MSGYLIRVKEEIPGMLFVDREEMREKYPEEMMERAIKGMLPKGRLGRQMYKKLHVYAGDEHIHMAQQPQVIDMGGKK